MAFCLVCAEPLEDTDTACNQCGTLCSDLNIMLRQAGKMTFLFGDAQAAAPDPVVETTQVPRSKPKPKSVKPKTESAKPRNPPPLPHSSSPADIIHARDAEVLRPSSPMREHFRSTAAAYALDVLICLVLNGLVVKLILVVSPRTLDQILIFSLIPMVFVLLSFSFLYFWLFFSLFEKTLGSLILERWRAP